MPMSVLKTGRSNKRERRHYRHDLREITFDYAENLFLPAPKTIRFDKNDKKITAISDLEK